MTEKPKMTVLQLKIPVEEVEAIDEWRRSHMPLKPRGPAIRWLLRFAVEHSQPKEEKKDE